MSPAISFCLSLTVGFSLKSSCYGLGFFICVHLHLGTHPMPFGSQITQRAWKWDAWEGPQLGSAGTEGYWRSSVPGFRMPSEYPLKFTTTVAWAATEILMWPCGDVQQKLWRSWQQLSAYLLTENNLCSYVLCQLCFFFLNLYPWRRSFLVDEEEKLPSRFRPRGWASKAGISLLALLLSGRMHSPAGFTTRPRDARL